MSKCDPYFKIWKYYKNSRLKGKKYTTKGSVKDNRALKGI